MNSEQEEKPGIGTDGQYTAVCFTTEISFYLPGCRPDTIIITNIGQGGEIDSLLKAAGAERFFDANGIVASCHTRSADELANRAFKDFGHEQPPFKKFNPNAAWCYSMLPGHFLMETFKEDAACQVISVHAYAATVRRKLIDVAGKIVSHSKKIILKVSSACLSALQFAELFEKCRKVPIIQ